MTDDRDKPKGPPRTWQEGMIRLSDGDETVTRAEVRGLERQHHLCHAAMEHPLALVKSRVVPDMFGGSAYGDFWKAAQVLATKDQPLVMSEVVVEMGRVQDASFKGMADRDRWHEAFTSSKLVSLDYALEVLVPEIVSAHDLKRFSKTTSELNNRVGKADPLPLFQRYLTETQEISRTPDGAQVNPNVGSMIQGWDASALAAQIVPSGIAAIDETSGGGPGKGDLVVFGGGTNHGKSYLAEYLLHSHAHIMGLPTLYLTVEDPKELMYCRMIARHTSPSVSPRHIRRAPKPGEPGHGSFSASLIEEAKKKVDPNGLMYIDQKRKGRIGVICDTLRRYRFQHGIVSATVDYLQAIQVDEPTKGTPNLVQETARKVAMLKECADQIGISLYVASQYARDEYRDGQEPSINACKYAGDIENESEIMILLWRSASGDLLAKIPKAKWVESKDPRYIVRRQAGTGCFLRWEHDFNATGQGQGQGQSQRGQSQRPGGYGGKRGAGRQL